MKLQFKGIEIEISGEFTVEVTEERLCIKSVPAKEEPVRYPVTPTPFYPGEYSKPSRWDLPVPVTIVETS
jgi:hypothetical protein